MRIVSSLVLCALAGAGMTGTPTPRNDTAPSRFSPNGGPDRPAKASDASKADREQTADQQVQHALNRLAFGPRPGDAEAVRKMGVDRWIARQLQPDGIPDPATATLLSGFKTLGMTGSELLEAYPPAGAAAAKLARERMAQGGGAATLTREDSAKLRANNQASYVFLAELSTSRLARAVVSERQLEENMVDFWENHFNVFAGKDRTRYFLAEY
ncbi:MAG: DUF1800 family protein, partial [Gemmatimonadota bacterium]